MQDFWVDAFRDLSSWTYSNDLLGVTSLRSHMYYYYY